jgi:hypothetical protein
MLVRVTLPNGQTEHRSAEAVAVDVLTGETTALTPDGFVTVQTKRVRRK